MKKQYKTKEDVMATYSVHALWDDFYHYLGVFNSGERFDFPRTRINCIEEFLKIRDMLALAGENVMSEDKATEITGDF